MSQTGNFRTTDEHNKFGVRGDSRASFVYISETLPYNGAETGLQYESAQVSVPSTASDADVTTLTGGENLFNTVNIAQYADIRIRSMGNSGDISFKWNSTSQNVVGYSADESIKVPVALTDIYITNSSGGPAVISIVLRK